MIYQGIPVLGLCAWSGTGKTTLLAQVIPLLKQKGLRLAVVKHGHHFCEVDHTGKDTYRYRQQGAEQIVLASKHCMVNISNRTEVDAEPNLQESLARLNTQGLDLILVEGFKYAAFPKLELHRVALGKTLLYPDDEHIIAIATDEPLESDSKRSLTHLDLNNSASIVDFIDNYRLNALQE